MKSRQVKRVKKLKLKKFAFYLVLFFLVFSLFNIFSIINLFIPAEKGLTVHAAYTIDTCDPGENCCIAKDNNGQDSWEACVEDYAHQLGLPTELGCSQTDGQCQHGDDPNNCWDVRTCNAYKFADLCVKGCIAKNGLSTTAESAKLCSDKDHCAVFPEYADNWDQIENDQRFSCDTCLDSCYGQFVDSPDASSEAYQCVDQCAFKPDYNVTASTSPCLSTDWITAWRESLPTDDTGRAMKACDTNCHDAKCVTKYSSYEKCVSECHAYVGGGGVGPADVTAFLACATPEGLEDYSNQQSASTSNADGLGSAIGKWKEGDSLQKLLGKLGECIFPELKPFCSNGGGQYAVAKYAQDVFSAGQVLFGALAMLKIIFGGVMYATAAGNPSQIQAAKEHIKYALIGIVLLLSINIILQLVGAGGYLLYSRG